MTTSRRAHPILLALVVGLLVAACGTRLSDDRILAANGGPASDDDGSSTAGSGASEGPESDGGAGVTIPDAAAGTTTGGPVEGGTGGSATTVAGSTGGSQGSQCTAQLAPIRVGQTGIFSGFLAPSTAGARTGLSVWAQEANARGGVQCHPIQLYQLDDASDPARATSNLRELIDDRKVVAVVGIQATITMSAVRGVVDPKEFPVVGGDLLADDWNEDPNLYPQGGTSFASLAGSPRDIAQATGAKTWGLIYCVEVNVCTGIHERAQQLATAAGVNFVFDQPTTLTQTDFTAECQNAKNKGVDNLFVAADGSALIRVARSCASIGYRPKFGAAGIATTQTMGQDPNVRSATVTLGTSTAPFPATDTPGAQAFNAAMKRYAPGQPLSQAAMDAYASGKLFEAALAQVAAARSGPVTTAMVKEGLGKIRGETLDGLSPPITFTAGKPAPRINCYFVIRLTDSGFTAPNGSKPQCF